MVERQAQLSPANDPLNDPDYFVSLINTLLESTSSGATDICLHDVIDAYATFSSKIRCLSNRLSQHEARFLALTSFKAHHNKIHYCIRRDIRRCFVDPYPSHPLPHPASEYSVPSGLPEDMMKYIVDTTFLCHQALRTLSDIFMHATLYLSFDSWELEAMFGDVLAIVLAPTLPTPNHRKTITLAAWILQSQRLPDSVLVPKLHTILSAVARLLKHIRAQADDEMRVDGIKTICALLHRHSYHLAPLLSSLLPSVLIYLTCDSLEVRYQVACILNCFAWSKIQGEIPGHSEAVISKHVQEFIQSQSLKDEPAPSPDLTTIMSTSFTVDAPAYSGEGPAWTLLVLASLIVLLDRSLFAHPASVKLIFPSLARAAAHKCNAIGTLQSHVWRCLIWAWSGIPLRQPGSTEIPDVEERAFLTLKQELREGLGGALVAAALGKAQEDGAEHADGQDIQLEFVSKCVTVLDEMMKCNDRSAQRQALAMLARLVSSIGDPVVAHSPRHVWKRNTILTSALFDGTLMHASWDEQVALVCSLGVFDLGIVRQLTEAEILRHWDSLMALLVQAAHLVSGQKNFSDNHLIHAWQSLLLVQSQLAEGWERLTTSPSVSARACAIIVDFLASPHSSSSVVETQARRLYLTARLWTVMTQVFEGALLAAPAEVILAAVLQLEFPLDVSEIESHWSGLCAALIPQTTPSVVERMCIRNEDQSKVDVKRHLWAVVAKQWSSTPSSFTCEAAVALLALPLRAWDISEIEMGLWDDMLKATFVEADAVSTRPTQIIERIVERVADATNAIRDALRLVALIIVHLNLDRVEVLPTTVLTVVNHTLWTHYPPRTEQLSALLKIFGHIRRLIRTATDTTVLHILGIMQSGLCVWIEDESEALLDSEYNRHIVPLYTVILDAAREITPSGDVLNKLAPFLTSAFVHVPPPALGPRAFAEFWEEIYVSAEGIGTCPEAIQIVLKAYQDVFGGNLLIVTSQDTVSHVPDSEPRHGSAPRARHGAQSSLAGLSPYFSGWSIFGKNFDQRIASLSEKMRFATSISAESSSIVMSSSEVQGYRATPPWRLQDAANGLGAISHIPAVGGAPEDTGAALIDGLSNKLSFDAPWHAPIPGKRLPENEDRYAKRKRASTEPAQKTFAYDMNTGIRRERSSRNSMLPETSPSSVLLDARPSVSGSREASMNTSDLRRTRRHSVSHPNQFSMSMEDDYDSWEVGLSTPDVRQFKEEFDML